MNLEKVAALSQKIEGVLKTVHALKEENATVKRELNATNAALQEKSMRLNSATNDLAKCKSLLDERSCEYNAQTEIIAQKDSELTALNEKLQSATINAETLSGQINEKSELINVLNTQVSEKDATIENLMQQLSEKNSAINSLNEQLQIQNDEINEAQEKFNQLVATIENELGTDIEIEENGAEQTAQSEQTEPCSQEESIPEVHSEDASKEDSQGNFFE